MPRQNKLIKKNELRAYITQAYDDFELKGITAVQALREVEDEIFQLKTKLERLQELHIDMLSHMGAMTDPFDRQKHTHGFANL